jgi:hypothetical protein
MCEWLVAMTFTRILAAALALAAAGPSRAAGPPASLTISGAVSMGSYEAGLVHYAVEAIRLNPAAATPRIATGASAGSVNAFITILQSCGAPVADPTESLLWKTWIPLGLDQLHTGKDTQRTGAFSRAAFQAPLDLIVRGWEAGVPASCDAVLGISVTRLVPRTVTTEGDRLRLPRVEEHFVLRVQGRGAGKAPRLTNYVDPSWDGEQALLPEEDGEVVFSAVVDALFASTAFPGAFPPQAVRHCIVRGGAGRVACPADQAAEDLFVDGGVFDNTPVRLATRVAAAGLRLDAGGEARWRDRPELGVRTLPPSLVVAHLSTDARTFPTATDEPHPEEIETLLGVVAQVGGAFYANARAKNLVYVQDESPEVFERLLVPERHLPAASSPLGAFFGFVEGELRRFDFALGMYDGRRLVQDRIGARLARAGVRDGVSYPEDTAGARKAAAAWRPYRCLKAVVDGEKGAEEACRGDELRDFRIVLQTSIERLWDRCARLEYSSGAYDADGLCRSARAGEPVLPVPFVEPLPGDAWRRSAEENETGYVMRLLVEHGFHFKDLGLGPEESRKAPAALRARFLRIGESVSETQPLGHALVLSTLVKMGADQVAYVPPRFTMWAVYGRDPEAGISQGFQVGGVFVSPVRLHAAVQLVGIDQVFSSEGGEIALGALLGAEYLPSFWASTKLQPSLLLRGGWLFSFSDDGGFSSCPDPASDAIGACSRPMVQGGVSAALLERVRLQLTANWYPPAASGQYHQWSIGPGIGVQWTY